MSIAAFCRRRRYRSLRTTLCRGTPTATEPVMLKVLLVIVVAIVLIVLAIVSGLFHLIF